MQGAASSNTRALPDLVLAVKGIYFDQMARGEKLEEFRLQNEYWAKRLEGRDYARVVITRGYPKAGDASRRLVFPWRGFRKCELQHPHFGPEPVSVYAIAARA